MLVGGALANQRRHSRCGQVKHIALTAGDSDMAVSATPSENTVRFYLGRGFQPMEEPLAEVFELEPEDLRMRKMLRATIAASRVQNDQPRLRQGRASSAHR